ncbi:MAG: PAS domain S-box protein [Synechococcales cyanobacterium C42_A2020_086]|jgi:PAS domain S-box-containing protein|nr:PAS domain S-box protein [Synechococcales cyanobacterium C42_A2020_086]
MTSERIVSLSEYHRLPQEALPADFYKRQFELVCNNATLALFIMDERQHCIYMNPAAEILTGYTLPETQGRPLHDVIHHTRPDGRPYPLSECPIDRAFPQNNQEKGEDVFIHKSGYFYPVAYTASPIREGDRVIGTVIEVRDITQEKAAAQREQTLRLEAEAAQQRVETILSSIHDGFYVLDRDWQFTYVNDRYCDMVGMSRSQLLGQNIWQLFPEAVETEAYHRFQQAMTAQTPVQFDYFYTPWQCWHDHRIYPSPSGLTVFLADITERKRVEAELRQKNAILDVINESTPTPIFVKDRQGRIIFANPATLQVLGKSAAEVIGYRDCDFYPNPDDAARVMENDQRIMTSGQMEVVEESPDGVRTFLGMKVPYRNEAGEVIGLIGISNDITERVQFERDREQLLQREQAAREAAEQANRLKDEFLAVLSHELRSPLNPILGWAKLLQTGGLDAAKTRQALATIERNAKLQAELIEDLLDVSRILRGKFSLSVSSVNLVTTIQAALETVRLAAEAKSITLDAQLDATVASISGDATRLQQVVWNLLSNAVKFTPSGGRVQVRLEQIGQGEAGRCASSDWNGGNRNGDKTAAASATTVREPCHPALCRSYVQIVVTDTGKGITPDFLPHVFDYFRQSDSATTRQFGGLGLGLAIVRHLVELHGGTVSAASSGEGQGATFTVKLPLLVQNSSSETLIQPALPASDVPLTGWHILVVDDDPDSREFVAFVLQQAGAEVTTAASAREGLLSLQQCQPDLLLSDIGMPEMDGYQLMQQVRSLPREQGGHIPALALTAYAGELNQQQALQAGFQHHLAKPIDPTQLVEVVAELLRQS